MILRLLGRLPKQVVPGTLLSGKLSYSSFSYASSPWGLGAKLPRDRPNLCVAEDLELLWKSIIIHPELPSLSG